jgi:hypothetical protein
MRFTPHGPSIPDDLLLARDRSEVVFFCGAGVSQARAGLSNFAQLARKVMERLGPSKKSPALKLLDVATKLDPIEGVGSFVATDRVFSLLEREFDTADIHAAVAAALKPQDGANLSAHEVLLDLAGRKSSALRMVTTNFDRLFEDCDPNVRSIGPAHLPDAKRAELNAVIHLHGRVDPEYLGSDEEGFVLSSGDFGRAYLADGWAARFIQSLLSRFSIVFVGYSADDPPVQYLLEALKGASHESGRMYAFQSGESAAAAALWENKGVHAMAYDPSNGHEALWSTLEAWAERANDVDGWYDLVLKRAVQGPEALQPYERGQIAHILSSTEGVRRLTQIAGGGIPASWLRVIDPRERYAKQENITDSSEESVDPFDLFGLDGDAPPPPPNPKEDEFSYVTRQREIPKDSWNGFDLYPADSAPPTRRSGVFYGLDAAMAGALPPRLDLLAIWLMNVAHQPEAFSWAMKQPDMHPRVKVLFSSAVRNADGNFPAEILRGWRYLFRTWNEPRDEPDQIAFAIIREANTTGWTDEMVRRLIGTRRSRLRIEPPFRARPSSDDERIFSLDIDYPRPHIDVEIPDEMLKCAVARLRENLDYAKSLEAEVRGSDWIYLPTTYETATQRLDLHAHGLVGAVLEMQRLMIRLTAHDSEAAHAELLRWQADDDGIFARLRIWAAHQPNITTAAEAAGILLGLSDSAFWGSLHQRDLMMTLSSRWNDLPQASRLELERKLTSTSYPWADTSRKDEYRDLSLFERLRWLTAQGVQFSFDVDELTEQLAGRLGGELPDIDAVVEDSQPRVYSIETDDNPAALIQLSVREILSHAGAAGELDYRNRVRRDPFSGLVAKRPLKALAALSYEAAQGSIHIEEWGTFLRPEQRENDSTRMLCLICARLGGLATAELTLILHPAADWMKRLSRRLHVELPDVFESLWLKMVEAAAISPPDDGERYSERNWADDGLNRPAGKLAQILLQDPRLSGRRRNSGLAADWKVKMETLLSLPGDMRRQALVFASFHFVLFWLLDPKWAEATIIPSMDSDGPDGDAFWDGFLWANRVLPAPLLRRMRSSIVHRVSVGSRRKPITDSLADILLHAWIEWSGRKKAPFTNTQFREAIVEGGTQFGVQVLWNLGRRLRRDTVSRDKVLAFFREVWPLQKALKSEETSRALSKFAFESGGLFPEVANLVAGRLVPCENFDTYSIYSSEPGGIVETYPEALLDVVARLLPTEVNRWPHHTAEILDRLAREPRLAPDPRLIRLRRAMGRPPISIASKAS